MYRVLSIKEHQGFFAARNGGMANQVGSYHPLDEKDFQELENLILSNSGREEDPLNIMTITHKKGIGKVIQAKNFVGVISLPSGLQIEILPKIDIVNDPNDWMLRKIFMKMLSSVLDLDYKTFKTADLDKASRIPLLEIFIRDFCEKIKNIIRLGVQRDYAIEEENLDAFKGKLVISEHVRRNVVHKERFFVAHDEFGLNAAENRIIKAALESVRKKTRSSRNRIDILQVLDSFESVPLSTDVNSDIQAVLSRRVSEYYAPAIRWGILFLRGYSFSTFSGLSGAGATALLFPMEKLFERYVTKELRRAAIVDGRVKIKTQEKSKSV